MLIKYKPFTNKISIVFVRKLSIMKINADQHSAIFDGGYIIVLALFSSLNNVPFTNSFEAFQILLVTGLLLRVNNIIHSNSNQ